MLRKRASPSSLSGSTCSLPPPTCVLASQELLPPNLPSHLHPPPQQMPGPAGAAGLANRSGSPTSLLLFSRDLCHHPDRGSSRRGAVWASSPSNRSHAPAPPAGRLQAPECTAPAVRPRTARPGPRLPPMPVGTCSFSPSPGAPGRPPAGSAPRVGRGTAPRDWAASAAGGGQGARGASAHVRRAARWPARRGVSVSREEPAPACPRPPVRPSACSGAAGPPCAPLAEQLRPRTCPAHLSAALRPPRARLRSRQPPRDRAGPGPALPPRPPRAAAGPGAALRRRGPRGRAGAAMMNRFRKWLYKPKVSARPSLPRQTPLSPAADTSAPLGDPRAHGAGTPAAGPASPTPS